MPKLSIARHFELIADELYFLNWCWLMKQNGFILLELLISFTLLVSIAGFLAYWQIQRAALHGRMKKRIREMVHAIDVVERYKATGKMDPKLIISKRDGLQGYYDLSVKADHGYLIRTGIYYDTR